ncbi:MAG: hypothetical protein ACSHYF_06680 [Verrucomicrobiaceae bacterium]
MKLLLLPLLLSFLAACAPYQEPVVVDTSTSAPPATYQPEITLRNLSPKQIMVGVKGPETKMIPVPAKSKLTIDLPAGTYNWAATAQNSPVETGTKTFEINQKYLWDFELK